MIYPEPEIILSDGKRVIKLAKGDRPIEATDVNIFGRTFTGTLIRYRELKYSDFADLPEADEYWVAVQSLDDLPKKQEGFLHSFRVGFGQIEIVSGKRVEGSKLRRRRERKYAVVFFHPFRIVEDKVEFSALKLLQKQINACRKEKAKLEEEKAKLQVEVSKWMNLAKEFKEKYDAASSYVLSVESEIREKLIKAKSLLKAAEVKHQAADALLKSLNEIAKEGPLSKLKGGEEKKEIEELRKEVKKLEREL